MFEKRVRMLDGHINLSGEVHERSGFGPPQHTVPNGYHHHLNGFHKSSTVTIPTTVPPQLQDSSSNQPSNAKNTPPRTTTSSAYINKWYSEYVLPNLYQASVLKETLHWAKSEFQELEILDLDPFGQCLVLDKRIQSASVSSLCVQTTLFIRVSNSFLLPQLDEFIYHECLVHPAMLAHPNPKTVFIGGGGEGGKLLLTIFAKW